MKKFINSTFSKFMGILIFLSVIFYANPSFAAGGPKIYTGTTNLISSITTMLLALIPIAAVVMILFHSLKKVSASDNQEVITKSNKAMKTILIYAAVGETASGLVTWFLSFYQ